MNFTQDLSKTSLEDLATLLEEAKSAQKHLTQHPSVPLRVVSIYHLGKGELFTVETQLFQDFVLPELARIEQTILSVIQKRTEKP